MSLRRWQTTEKTVSVLEKYIVVVASYQIHISRKKKNYEYYNQYYVSVIELGIIAHDESGKNICNVYSSLAR